MLPSMNTHILSRVTRAHWYWLMQLLGWSAVVVFVMFSNGRYMYQFGTVLVCLLFGVCGLVLSDLAHRLFNAWRWHVQPAAWRIVAFTILIYETQDAAAQMIDQLAHIRKISQGNDDALELQLDGMAIDVSRRRAATLKHITDI